VEHVEKRGVPSIIKDKEADGTRDEPINGNPLNTNCRKEAHTIQFEITSGWQNILGSKHRVFSSDIFIC
jgi:hypothetical protein